MALWLHGQYQGEEAMSKHASQCGGGNQYLKRLLVSNQRELQALELKHQQQQIPSDTYFSCRRALLDNITEISCLAGDAEQNDPVDQKKPEEPDRTTSSPEPTLTCAQTATEKAVP
jgi:hypothetical protein